MTMQDHINEQPILELDGVSDEVRVGAYQRNFDRLKRLEVSPATKDRMNSALLDVLRLR
jgi:hypothetical protein